MRVAVTVLFVRIAVSGTMVIHQKSQSASAAAACSFCMTDSTHLLPFS